jgi:putative acetyltransferase
VRIVVDDLTSAAVAELLEEHLADMVAATPEPESRHALDLDGLRRPEVTFWSVWDDGTLVGCGAIKRLDDTHAELKSMRTTRTRQGGGIGSTLLRHILDEAQAMSFARMSLETGSQPFFAPARRLYEKFGFTYCEPFADYRRDPRSVFMTRPL